MLLCTLHNAIPLISELREDIFVHFIPLSKRKEPKLPSTNLFHHIKIYLNLHHSKRNRHPNPYNDEHHP